MPAEPFTLSAMIASKGFLIGCFTFILGAISTAFMVGLGLQKRDSKLLSLEEKLDEHAERTEKAIEGLRSEVIQIYKDK